MTAEADVRRAYVCMGVVVLVYAVKVAVKISVGHEMGSAAMVGDGFHNLSDIVEALLVLVVLYVGALPENERFPLGKTSIDSILALGIGVALGALGLSFLAGSFGGLLVDLGAKGTVSTFLTGLTPGDLARGNAHASWLGLTVAAASIVVSLLVSMYQVRVGRETGRDALVADGRETLSDSLVESAILAGLVGTWIGLPLADRVAGLVVSGFILRTSWSILSQALLVLLNASIPKEQQRELAARVGATKGVTEARKVFGYRIGRQNFVVLSLRVAPHLSDGTLVQLRRGLESLAREIVPDMSRSYVHFEPDDHRRWRALIPVAAFEGGGSLILAEPAGHRYLLAEVAGQEVVRAEVCEFEGPTDASPGEILRHCGADVFLLGAESEAGEEVPHRKVAGVILEDLLG